MSDAVLARPHDVRRFNEDAELIYQPSTCPGARLPHVWIEQNRQVLVHDDGMNDNMDIMTDSPERAIRKDVARNRARLLQAADELVAEQGLEISLNELARRAGVGVGTVYRHFADKDAVIDALFEGRLDILAQVMRDATQREDPIEALRYAVFTICELQASDRALFQTVATGRTAEQRERTRERLEPLATKIVERAKATGRMRADFAPTDLPVLLWTSMAVSDLGGTVRPDLWRRYVEVALAGFAAAGEPQQAIDVEPLSPKTMELVMRNWQANHHGHGRD